MSSTFSLEICTNSSRRRRDRHLGEPKRPLLEVDSLTSRLAPEVVSLLAAEAGTYRIEVRAVPLLMRHPGR